MIKAMILILIIFGLSSPTWSENVTGSGLVEIRELHDKKSTNSPFTDFITKMATWKK